MKYIVALIAIVIVVATMVVIITTVPQEPKPIQRAAADLDSVYPTFRVPTATFWPTVTPWPSETPTATPDLQATESFKQLMLLSAQQTIDVATAQAAQLTQVVIDLQSTRSAVETQKADGLTQTAQAAMATHDAQILAITADAAALVASQTADTARLVASQTQVAGIATQRAAETQSAQVFAQQAVINDYQQRQLALATEREELTNALLAFAPYVLALIAVLVLVWLAVDFGRAEVFRRAWVLSSSGDPVVMSGHVQGVDRGRSFGPALKMNEAAVSVDHQAVVTARAQAVDLLRAANGGRAQAERMLKDSPEPAPVIRVARQLPASADLRDLMSRKPGEFLLGAGMNGTIAARQNTPHVLIAGQTGSGKSTTVKSIIMQHILDGNRVVILDKSGKDFDVFQGHATVITFDAAEPENAVKKLVGYMRAAWGEILKRQKLSKPVWKGATDVLVIDELDNWQDVAEDADISIRELWRFPRMIVREGRSSKVYALTASQSPTAQNVSIDFRRNCTPIAHCLADAAASRTIIDAPDAVGLQTGQFIAYLDERVKGIGYHLEDDDIKKMLRGIRPQSRPEWLDAVDYAQAEVIEVKAAEEDWQAQALELHAQGKGFGVIAGELHKNYYTVSRFLQANGATSATKPV